ncbi:MAG: type 2 lanthipeptide synthetase LanM family protein [Xanthobacteraceae bacterium]
MEALYERLMVRAATIDELLSDAFEPLPGKMSDGDLAGRRLAAWCRSCAGGDWSLFEQRLERDGLSVGQVLAKFGTVRRKSSASVPAWIDDAIWIEAALQQPTDSIAPGETEPCPFEHLLIPVVQGAEKLLWASADARASDNLNQSARACLRQSLLRELAGLLAPAIYERFAKAREADRQADGTRPPGDGASSLYDEFVASMRAGGFRRLFEDKPVLLRLMASITRQWINTSRELVVRIGHDLATVRRALLHSGTHSQIVGIEGELSDPHNQGRTVKIVVFEDGSRTVYKPKDLRLDAAWHDLVERLNADGAPVELKAARTLVRDSYGWTEFVDHIGCSDAHGCKRFFRRAGAWLALFYCFSGTDLHQENIVAAGDHPVPIDLEMMLQAIPGRTKTEDSEADAFEAAMETVANSVLVVGLLPAYGKAPDNSIFEFGGVTSNWATTTRLAWNDINSDTMRPSKATEVGSVIPNLPHVDGRYARFGDHIDDFVAGFEDYATFLLHRTGNAGHDDLLKDFAGVPVRKILRPTRFYAMLLQRLKDHRTMEDGVVWSAQADFVARLTDWEETDPVWPLQSAERAALVALNVPHFVLPADGNEIRDANGIALTTDSISGLDRTRARFLGLDEREIDWQAEIIRQNTGQVSRSTGSDAIRTEPKALLRPEAATAPTREVLVAQADAIAEHLSRHAIRRGPSAAWVGLDWPGDSEVSQLVALGPELYNGVCGIALFLAAHASVARRQPSAGLALASLAHLRKNLRSRNAARMARTLGIGGGNGLGSIVYALTVMSNLLPDNELLADAEVAAEQFTDDLIAADRHLDVMGGSAGAILCLLRLYRQNQSSDVLGRATKCGRHLLAQHRAGPEGLRSWSVPGSGQRPLNGMSHGAAGFAYALASLASATGQEEFADAARECIAFENSSYNADRNNWPDLRNSSNPAWPCQWCHGAIGVGLARIAMTKSGMPDLKVLTTDLHNAIAGAERGWPGRLDTLCCGTLGAIEFFCEAGDALGRGDLRELASQRLMAVVETATSTGDYRWNSGTSRFNLGLFRGLAGAGYTILRQVDRPLPNVLIWE